MAISHAVSGQVIDLQPLGTRLHSEKTVALFKAQDLELMRLVLPQGKSMPVHKVAGEITVQCIEGRIDVTALGHSMCCLRGSFCTCLAACCTVWWRWKTPRCW
jgi:quercetin dioxygenase-like cupin family protein